MEKVVDDYLDCWSRTFDIHPKSKGIIDAPLASFGCSSPCRLVRPPFFPSLLLERVSPPQSAHWRHRSDPQCMYEDLQSPSPIFNLLTHSSNLLIGKLSSLQVIVVMGFHVLLLTLKEACLKFRNRHSKCQLGTSTFFIIPFFITLVLFILGLLVMMTLIPPLKAWPGIQMSSKCAFESILQLPLARSPSPKNVVKLGIKSGKSQKPCIPEASKSILLGQRITFLVVARTSY